jgi:hypothetical protein
MLDSRALGLTTTPDPLNLSQDAGPICLGSGRLTQGTWVCTPVDPLGEKS